LTIVYCDPAQLTPRSANPRVHSAKQIRQIAASIEQFGFVNPVLVDRNGNIIAGHGRVLGAIDRGMSEIPTVCVDHLAPAQIRAYVIADNRLAELAGWDRKILALELGELSVDLDFDVTVTGFDTGDIDILINEMNEQTIDEADEVPDVDRSQPATSRLGDLWQIGGNFLYCGNALEKDSYIKLLRGKKAELVFTDPPYNVAIAGNVSGLGRHKHREFAMASGEMDRPEFTKFLGSTFERLCNASASGSIHFICMDWRHMREVLDAAETSYGELKNVCVWVKTNAGMGSLYRSQHEFVFVFKNGSAAHVNNVELGRHGRNRSKVWPYAGANAFGKERDADLEMHPTVKPLALVADAIMDCSKHGAIVLDAFAGSGTTLIAAQRTGRKGYGIELDPHYADTIIRRFDRVFGLKSLHTDSGLNFEQLSAIRLAPEEKQHVEKTSKTPSNSCRKHQPKGRSR
jgi:DNA modification methylase